MRKGLLALSVSKNSTTNTVWNFYRTPRHLGQNVLFVCFYPLSILQSKHFLGFKARWLVSLRFLIYSITFTYRDWIKHGVIPDQNEALLHALCS